MYSVLQFLMLETLRFLSMFYNVQISYGSSRIHVTLYRMFPEPALPPCNTMSMNNNKIIKYQEVIIM